MRPSVLGLDCSSVCIGWCYIDACGIDTGHIDLRGDIAARINAAYSGVAELLHRYGAEVVALESPVARFAKAVIPQARVSGAVILALHRSEQLWIEVSPSAAKLRLTGHGNATKAAMVGAASAALAGRKLTEDEADAYALALVARDQIVTRGAA